MDIWNRASPTCRSNTAPSEAFSKLASMEGCAAKLTVPVDSFSSFMATITTIRRLLQEARSNRIDCHNAFTEILISKSPGKPIKISLRAWIFESKQYCTIGEPFPKLAKHGRLRCEVDRPCGLEVFRSFSGNNNNHQTIVARSS
uniref:Uncharacterized protein n=1 Tax=Salix viminalis TaxID=40686 RepID=A0A6N2N7K6_SALVM